MPIEANQQLLIVTLLVSSNSNILNEIVYLA